MTQQDKEQLKLEIDHIFESGANEIRIFEMVVNFIDSRNGVNKNFVLADVRRSCSNCKFFESFRDAYYDNMEPDDVGFCRNGERPRFGNEGANSGYVCDFHNYA